MDLNTLIDEIAEAVMIDRGYDVAEKETYIEWDATREDSQYSLVREDVEFIVDLLNQRKLLKDVSQILK